MGTTMDALPMRHAELAAMSGQTAVVMVPTVISGGPQQASVCTLSLSLLLPMTLWSPPPNKVVTTMDALPTKHAELVAMSGQTAVVMAHTVISGGLQPASVCMHMPSLFK